MLPGFRFLFGAIVFSLSILVFGLGAAALLRAAHEQFASNTTWRAAPTTGFNTFLPQPDQPVLAVLQVDPRLSVPIPALPAAVEAPDKAAEDTVDAVAPAGRGAAERDGLSMDTSKAVQVVPEAAVPAPEVVTAVAVPMPAPTAADQADIVSVEHPTTDVTDSAAAVLPSAVTGDTKSRDMATTQVADATPAPTQPDTTAATSSRVDSAEPVSSAIATPTSPASTQPTPKTPDPIAIKIASLEDQPAIGEKQPAAGENEQKASVKVASVQLHRSVVKKRIARERLAARRAKQQRLLAQRARVARQAAIARQQQLAADPFAQQPTFAQPPPFGQQAAFGQQPAFGQQAATQRVR
ncbi:hypothetical protein ACQR1W_21950 [Bradyrhizobium sp. HKCCYLS1011]|uniref:hypothetical protein n=1 Tax=Bradyrhizobium sp. HKCCYLS1011 TaxID=3420733 RepID=UPI003EBF3956